MSFVEFAAKLLFSMCLRIPVYIAAVICALATGYYGWSLALWPYETAPLVLLIWLSASNSAIFSKNEQGGSFNRFLAFLLGDGVVICFGMALLGAFRHGPF